MKCSEKGLKAAAGENFAEKKTFLACRKLNAFSVPQKKNPPPHRVRTYIRIVRNKNDSEDGFALFPYFHIFFIAYIELQHSKYQYAWL